MPDTIYYKPQSTDFYVYLLCNPLKEGCPPFYVGKGKDDRCFEHFRDCHAGQNQHKWRTIKTIESAGLQVPIHIAWAGTSEEQALWIEQFIIAIHGTRYDETGILTNLTKGGDGLSGWIPTEEARRKMSAAQKGIKRRDETKRKMSEAQKGNQSAKGIKRPTFSPEVRSNMSEAHKGLKCSDETKRKMSEAHKGKKFSAEAKQNMRDAWKLRKLNR